MADDSFEKEVDKIVANVKAKMIGVIKTAIQETVQDMQTPRAAGGKMPVDTGFLRSSGAAALNQMPVGEIQGREREPGEVGVLSEYRYTGDFLPLTLGRMELGDKFCFGWTAYYAEKQELYNGFMDSAIQNWSNTVDNVARRLKK